MYYSEGLTRVHKNRRPEQDKSISHDGKDPEDLADHLLIEKAKRVKGKAVTLEEYEAIRAYDAAKASGGEAIPFDQAMREIRKSRQ